jgi:hypothetical protein
VAVVGACALGVAILLLLVWVGARSAITIAVLEVEGGKVRVTRGGLAPRVLEDLRDVLARPRVESATVRVLRDKDHARLEVTGKISEQQMQRIRTVVGPVTLAQLVNARRR